MHSSQGRMDFAPRGGAQNKNTPDPPPSTNQLALGGLDPPPSTNQLALGGLDPPPSTNQLARGGGGLGVKIFSAPSARLSHHFPSKYHLGSQG